MKVTKNANTYLTLLKDVKAGETVEFAEEIDGFDRTDDWLVTDSDGQDLTMCVHLRTGKSMHLRKTRAVTCTKLQAVSPQKPSMSFATADTRKEHDLREACEALVDHCWDGDSWVGTVNFKGEYLRLMRAMKKAVER